MTCILRRIVCASARARILGLLALVGFALLTVGDSKEKRVRAEPLAMKAVDPDPVPAGEQPLATNVVRQGFPAAKADSSDLTKSDTAWEIEWELTHPLNR